MTTRYGALFAAALVALGGLASAAYAQQRPVDANRLNQGHTEKGNWFNYHGNYKSYHYADLDQINKGNVKNLRVAWLHQPGRPDQGLESTPIAIDGVLYYSGSYSRLFALDGATGKEIWRFIPKLDEDLVAVQTHKPYNRGVAAGHGNIYVGTMDGRVIAVDMKTGRVAWDQQVVNSKKETVGFTGAPIVAKDLVVIGTQGGEWPVRGRIYGLDAKSGQERWVFYTVAGPEDPEAMKTWGGDSWRTGGGGGWMAGTYDPETDTIWWGTANPAPLYDWAAEKWMTEGPRPGVNLYITSVVGLNPANGKLKWYHQQLPHDPWDFDASVGEFMSIDRDGKKYMVHPNKGGFIYVYDRTNGKFANAWPLVKNYNFIKGVDKEGKLVEPFYPKEGKGNFLCPYIAGGIGWNSGSYSPKTGLYYKIAQEWCGDFEVVRTTPVTEPQAQLNIGANFTLKHPKDDPQGRYKDEAHGHLDARDPITGKVKWSKRFRVVPIASTLATAGNLVFLGDSEGVVHAYDAENGNELWSFNNGSGHRGGPISYMAKGKQYVAVPSGWGSLVAGDFPQLWPEFADKPQSATLVVFALP
jgi:alcohol dehydrogenase (cytochrome c)